MTWGAVAGVAASVVGGAIQSDAARKSAHTQADAARAASAAEAAAKKPYVDAGNQAIGQLSAGTAPGGQFMKPFSMDDMKNVMPAYQFALGEGTKAIENSAAARSGLLNSNAIEGETKFAENLANQFETTAFNQYQAGLQQQLQPLETLANIGQTATSQTGDTAANATLAAGGANAAGQVGQANAAVGTIDNTIGALGGLFGVKTPTTGSMPANPYNSSGGNGYGLSGGDIGVFTPGSNFDPNGALGGRVSAGDYSDERLKKDVVRVGQTNSGLPIYRYRFRAGDDRVRLGVMAQDVEKVNPGAVSHDRRGFKLVDYAQVH